MCNGNDDDFVRVNDVDDVVAECAESELANARRQRFSCERTFGDEADGFLQILLEPISEAFTLLIEINDRLVDLCFGRLQEARLPLLLA